MKNFRLTWGMLAFSVFLTFTACQKEEEAEPDFAATEFQLADLNGLETPGITGASNATDASELRCRPTDSTRTHALANALRQLNLNERQRKAVRSFAVQHHACVSDHLTRIHALHRELLHKANQVREEHLKAYREGKITRAQLEERLAHLRSTLAEQLAKHDVKLMHMRALRGCRLELLKKIESVLNQEQLQKWNTWKRSLI